MTSRYPAMASRPAPRNSQQVINLIGRVKADYELPNKLKLVLITNGSLIDRPGVQAGLSAMAQINGEVWFKLDSVTREGRQRINNTRMSLMRMRENLRLATILCPTWLQTCVFQIDGMAPSSCGIGCVSKISRGISERGRKTEGRAAVRSCASIHAAGGAPADKGRSGLDGNVLSKDPRPGCRCQT